MCQLNLICTETTAAAHRRSVHRSETMLVVSLRHNIELVSSTHTQYPNKTMTNLVAAANVLLPFVPVKRLSIFFFFFYYKASTIISARSVWRVCPDGA